MHQSLLDQITLVTDDPILRARYAKYILCLLSGLGNLPNISIRVQARLNFGALETAYKAAPGSYGSLNPIFRAESSSYPGFWLEGVDSATGELMVTQACRIIETEDRSMLEKYEDLTAVYDRPLEMAAADERIVISGEARDVLGDMRGRIAFSGATYVNPKARGQRISRFITPLCHVLAFGAYGVDRVISAAEDKLNNAGIVARYGYRKYCSRMSWTKENWLGTVDLLLLHKDERDLLDDLAILDGTMPIQTQFTTAANAA